MGTAPGNRVRRVHSLGVTVGSAPGKYEHESRPQPGKRVIWVNEWLYWWYKEGIETEGNRSREVPVKNQKHTCPCMLDDLSSTRRRASIEPQKRRDSTKHVLLTSSTAAHRHGSLFFIIFAVSNSIVTESSECLSDLREPPLESWVRYFFFLLPFL